MLQLGFDSLYFARIDYQDRAKRKDEKALEVIWRGSRSLSSSSQVDQLQILENCLSRLLDLFNNSYFILVTLKCFSQSLPTDHTVSLSHEDLRINV